jgi:hypothetical protein
MLARLTNHNQLEVQYVEKMYISDSRPDDDFGFDCNAGFSRMASEGH